MCSAENGLRDYGQLIRDSLRRLLQWVMENIVTSRGFG
jgi:hypothetical protein